MVSKALKDPELLVAYGGLMVATITLLLTLIEFRRFRLSLQHQTRHLLYEFWFDWDRMLLDNPDLYDALHHPSEQLSSRERALAEYRLDLAELLWREDRSGNYSADPKFWPRLVNMPLLRRALENERTLMSIRADFRDELQRAIETRETAVEIK